jgi:hypothetical protein
MRREGGGKAKNENAASAVLGVEGNSGIDRGVHE